MECDMNPDDNQECSCLVEKNGKLVCDIYDEPIEDVKKCPIK